MDGLFLPVFNQTKCGLLNSESIFNINLNFLVGGK